MSYTLIERNPYSMWFLYFVTLVRTVALVQYMFGIFCADFSSLSVSSLVFTLHRSLFTVHSCHVSLFTFHYSLFTGPWKPKFLEYDNFHLKCNFLCEIKLSWAGRLQDYSEHLIRFYHRTKENTREVTRVREVTNCHTRFQLGIQFELNSCKYHLASWATKWHDYVPVDHHPPTHHPTGYLRFGNSIF